MECRGWTDEEIRGRKEYERDGYRRPFLLSIWMPIVHMDTYFLSIWIPIISIWMPISRY